MANPVLYEPVSVHPQHPHPREALIEQLWPEIDPEARRSSLRTALYSLRQLLEQEDVEDTVSIRRCWTGPPPLHMHASCAVQMIRVRFPDRTPGNRRKCGVAALVIEEGDAHSLCPPAGSSGNKACSAWCDS